MSTQNQSFEALQEAITIAGSQVALANLLKKYKPNISQSHIQKWLKSPVGVPSDGCVLIEKETGITRKSLRPNDWENFWPELQE
ncbi:transcriptional regulator [Undibacterium sp. TJN19]|uniref:transcriptional regulator n=1 Tax=Undibacterium sp. TJN19 TaxID=3413055 RepID=UPI003BF37255